MMQRGLLRSPSLELGSNHSKDLGFCILVSNPAIYQRSRVRLTLKKRRYMLLGYFVPSRHYKASSDYTRQISLLQTTQGVINYRTFCLRRWHSKHAVTRRFLFVYRLVGMFSRQYAVNEEQAEVSDPLTETAGFLDFWIVARDLMQRSSVAVFAGFARDTQPRT